MLNPSEVYDILFGKKKPKTGLGFGVKTTPTSIPKISPLPEDKESKTHVGGDLSPRTQEMYAKPSPPTTDIITGKDVVEQWTGYINGLFGMAEAYGKGHYYVGDQPKWLSKKEKDELGQKLMHEATKVNLYYHVLPQATRNLIGSWKSYLKEVGLSKAQKQAAQIQGKGIKVTEPSVAPKPKPAPTTEIDIRMKFENQLMKKLYPDDWFARPVSQEIKNKALKMTQEYLKGFAPKIGRPITGATRQIQTTAVNLAEHLDEQSIAFMNKMNETARMKWAVQLEQILAKNPAISIQTVIDATDIATGAISPTLHTASAVIGKETAPVKPSEEELITEQQRIDIPSDVYWEGKGQVTGIMNKEEATRIADYAEEHNVDFDQARRILAKTDASLRRKRQVVARTETERPEYAGQQMYGVAGQKFDSTVYAADDEQLPEAQEPAPTPTPPTDLTPVIKPEEIGRVPEEMGGKAIEFRKGMRPKQLPKKIADLYEKIEASDVQVAKLTQERTIMKLVEQGQEQVARDAFRQGKKQGMIESDIEWEDWVQRAKLREQGRARFRKAHEKMKFASSLAKRHQLRPLHQKMVEGILDKFDLSKPRIRTVYELQRMADFHKEHPEHEIPQHYLDKLVRLSKTPIQDLTIEEVEDIAEEVNALVAESANINRMITKRGLVEAERVKTQAVDNIRTKPTRRGIDPTEIDSGDFENRAKGITELAGVKSWNAELICDVLDLKGETPVIRGVLYDGINDGTDDFIEYEDEADTMFQQGLQEIGITRNELQRWSRAIGGRRAKPQTVNITKGRKLRMTKAERVSFILHSMNEKNIKHITNGGFSFEHNKTRITRGITLKDLRVIAESATPEERRMVGLIRNIIDRMGVKLNEVSVKLYGREIFKEVNYWRIRTNALDRYVDALKTREFGHKTLEGMGFLKERRNAQNAIIVGDAFDVLYKHITQTAAFYGLAIPLRNAKMLLYDKDFRRTITQTRGGHYWRALQNYLRDIEGDAVNISDVEKIATKWVNKIDLAILGLNPFVMLKQPVSYLMASVLMNPMDLLRAIPTKVDYNEIRQWSPQLRRRLRGNITRELGELGKVGAVRRFFTHKQPVSHKVMEGIRFFDYQTIGRIWNATKVEVRRQNPGLQGDEFMQAVKVRAEEVIRKTQPTFDLKDRSEIGRMRGRLNLIKLATKYMSQRNKNYMLIRRSMLDYEKSGKTPKDKAKLLSRLSMILIGNAALITAIDELRGVVYKRKLKSPVELAVDAVGNMLGNIYFIGDFYKVIVSKMQRGKFGYDWNNPLSSTVNDFLEGMGLIGQAIEQGFSGERYVSGDKKDKIKWKTTALRALDKTLRGITPFMGIPYRTLKAMVGAGVRWVKPEDKTSPKSIEEALYGKSFSKSSTKRQTKETDIRKALGW